MLNFPVIPRAAADAMRTNRHASELMMLPTDWRDDRMPERAIVQIKWDGIHAGYRQGARQCFTREGVEMGCTAHLASGLQALTGALAGLFGQQHMLFGEYVHADGFEATLGDFKRGTGSGVVQVFDAVAIDEYEGRAQGTSLAVRLHRMRRAFDRVSAAAIGNVMQAKSTLFVDEARENIITMMPQLWEQGLEGVVVKDADSAYERCASPAWQRVKQRNTVDLPIIRVDAPSGRLKALVVATPAGVEVRVGVGFSDGQRSVPKQFRPGMIVELRHLGHTGSGSLRSPSFVRLRSDKES